MNSNLRLRAPRKLVSEMNVVPYIDVMLVLLVIFMATAPMMTQGISVELPATNSAPLDTSQDEPVVVSVNAEGRYFINVGGENRGAEDLATIRQRALAIFNQKPNTLFLVEGDQRVAYGRVVTLMSTLQEAGINQVGLVTEPRGRDE